MKIFVIEAYGGPETTDGPIVHFTVQAESVDEAVSLVRRSKSAQRFERIEVVGESAEFHGDTAEIVSEGEGPYERAP